MLLSMEGTCLAELAQGLVDPHTPRAHPMHGVQSSVGSMHSQCNCLCLHHSVGRRQDSAF